MCIMADERFITMTQSSMQMVNEYHSVITISWSHKYPVCSHSSAVIRIIENPTQILTSTAGLNMPANMRRAPMLC